MKNTGFSRLILIDPSPYDVPETFMMGWKSEDIIKNAIVFSNIKEALNGYHFVVGTTRRRGKGRDNLFPLEELLDEMVTVAKGNKVAILGDNDPQWYWAEIAIQAAGAIVVGVFVDAAPQEIKYIIDHSDSNFVIAADQEQVDKILGIADGLPKLDRQVL